MAKAFARASCALVSCAALVFAGCSGGKGTITGTVTLNGSPLPAGIISFHSEVGNKEVFNAPIQNGNYSIEGVPAGKARVTVRVAKSGPAPASGAAKGGLPAPSSGGDTGATTPSKSATPVVTVSGVPDRYGDPDKSGLELDVQSGSQTFPVTLTP
jgi:hypothetical protein